MGEVGDAPDSNGPERQSPRVGSVSSAISVLRLLAREPTGIGVNAAARTLGMNQSSCYNILKTLVSERFAEFDPKSKLYTLGIGAIGLGRHALDPANAFEQVRPIIEAVTETYGSTTGLWRVVERPRRLVLLGHAESSALTRIHLSPGQRLPWLIGAMGRCISATLDLGSDEIERELQGLRWDDPPPLDEYRLQVERARRLGWAVDQDRFARGATTVAVPIVDGAGKPRYCVSTTMFTGQVDASGIRKIASTLIRAADALAERLLHRPGAADQNDRGTSQPG